MQVQILRQAPIHARLAQRQSGCFTRSGSGFRNSQRVPSWSLPLKVRDAADNRETQERYLQGLPTQTENVMTDKLPDGVHRLSEESQEILRRAAERDAQLAARHTKRAS